MIRRMLERGTDVNVEKAVNHVVSLDFELRHLRRHALDLERMLCERKELARVSAFLSVPEARPAFQATEGGVHRKQSRDRMTASGLDQERAFCLELNALARITQRLRGDEAAHFPSLLGFDRDACVITMTHVGVSLDAHEDGSVIRIPDLEGQVDRILSGLEICGITYLDMHASGKNLTVNDVGVLSIIDFDVVVLDATPISGELEHRYTRYHSRGGAGFLRSRILSIVEAKTKAG